MNKKWALCLPFWYEFRAFSQTSNLFEAICLPWLMADAQVDDCDPYTAILNGNTSPKMVSDLLLTVGTNCNQITRVRLLTSSSRAQRIQSMV